MSNCIMDTFSTTDAQGHCFLIRPMRRTDVPEVIKLRQKVRIHDTPYTLQTWLKLDPLGIKVVENESGEIIGTCSAVKQTDDMYYVGLYFILEEYRGCGIGVQIWNACMERVTNAALNALPGRAEIFRTRAGFNIVETEYMFNRNMTSCPVDPQDLSSHLPRDVTIEPFNKSHLPHIFAYDFALVGYSREQFLELSFKERKTRTFVAYRNGACVGFGSIKTSCLGAGRVSPLFADDSAIAEGLLRSLIVSMPKVNGFAMMTVSNNVPANRLMKKLDCPMTSQVTRMYKGKKMSINTNKVFGIFDGCFAMF